MLVVVPVVIVVVISLVNTSIGLKQLLIFFLQQCQLNQCLVLLCFDLTVGQMVEGDLGLWNSS